MHLCKPLLASTNLQLLYACQSVPFSRMCWQRNVLCRRNNYARVVSYFEPSNGGLIIWINVPSLTRGPLLRHGVSSPSQLILLTVAKYLSSIDQQTSTLR